MDDCRHEITALRRFTMVNGTTHFTLQCQNPMCLERPNGRFIGRKELLETMTDAEIDGIEPFDHEGRERIKEEAYQAVRRAYAAQRDVCVAPSSSIKAIETRYMGYHFRSRLEARYAVFFDALDLDWEYEPQGYVLSDGTHYLPDFHLPRLGIFVEVKGADPTAEENRIAALFGHSVCALALFHGTPGDYWGTLYCLDTNESGGGEGKWPVDWSTDGFGRALLATDKYGHDLHQPDWSDNLIVFDWSETLYNRYGPPISRAADAARSARFEFGESGAT